MPVRLAVLVSHPIQHFAPWHRELAKISDIDLRVFFFAEWGRDASYFDKDFQTSVKWEVPLLEGYNHEFLPSAPKVRKPGFLEVDNPDVVAALDSFSPDVVMVFGWGYRTNWRVASWARRHRKPLLIYCDTNVNATTKWWKRAIKDAVIARFYSHVDGAMFVGDNNREFHRSRGIPEARLFRGALPIDRKRLIASVPDREAARAEVRGRHEIPSDAFVVMFCGKYSTKKSPVDLVAAADKTFKGGLPVWALMVGEGDQRSVIEEYCRGKNVKNAVLTGFINQSEIAKFFAASDALAVTSQYDPHPLVVTEAASFGLPVIASDRIGCIGATDTAQPNVNTIVYPWGDRERLRAAIETLLQDRKLYQAFASASVRISESQDVSVTAQQLADAAAKLQSLGPR
jgi:glycosyltransferase involved in cell wall biosynthesis